MDEQSPTQQRLCGASALPIYRSLCNFPTTKQLVRYGLTAMIPRFQFEIAAATGVRLPVPEFLFAHLTLFASQASFDEGAGYVYFWTLLYATGGKDGFC